MKKMIAFALFALVGSATLATAHDGPHDPSGQPYNPGTIYGPGTFDLEIKNFAYTPSYINIVRGTTLRWVNLDGIGHTVTSQTFFGSITPSGVFDSGDMEQGQTYSFTFDVGGGEYPYYCIPHGSSMQGIVNVVNVLVPEPGALGLLAVPAVVLMRRSRK